MKKLNLAFGLMLTCSMLLFPAKSFAADTPSQTLNLDVNIPTVVLPYLAANGSTTITPTVNDFPVNRANTSIGGVVTNHIELGNGTLDSATSYVLTNYAADASAIPYRLTASGSNATIADETNNIATITLDDGGLHPVKLWVREHLGAGAATLGTQKFTITPGASGVGYLETTGLTFTTNAQSAPEADLDMALYLDRGTLTYSLPKHDYTFSLVLTSVGL